MRARRTPGWYYVIAVLLGLTGGICLASWDGRSSVSLIGAPWIVPIVLLLLGLVVLVLCLQVHAYATTDPAKRRSRLDPTKAMTTLLLAKSLGVASAALLGWYTGQVVMTLSHAEATYYSDAIVQCLVTAGVCLVDLIIGIVGEWLCQIPPQDGPESARNVGSRSVMASPVSASAGQEP